MIRLVIELCSLPDRRAECMKRTPGNPTATPRLRAALRASCIGLWHTVALPCLGAMQRAAQTVLFHSEFKRFCIIVSSVRLLVTKGETGHAGPGVRSSPPSTKPGSSERARDTRVKMRRRLAMIRMHYYLPLMTSEMPLTSPLGSVQAAETLHHEGCCCH